MPTRRSSGRRDSAAHRFTILLEAVELQNRATIEAVQAVDRRLTARIDDVEKRLSERIDALGTAVQIHSADLRKNSEVIAELNRRVGLFSGEGPEPDTPG
jgi:hypothetical protein